MWEKLERFFLVMTVWGQDWYSNKAAMTQGMCCSWEPPRTPHLDHVMRAFPRCISLLGLPWQNITDRVTQTAETYFLTVLEVASPRGRCWQGWFSSEASALGLHLAALLLPLHVVLSLGTCTPGVSLWFLISSSYKDTGQIGLEPTPTDSF